MAYEPTWSPDYWRRRLAGAPTWALVDEMTRREPAASTTALTLGDLVVDPIRSAVRWRGDEYVVPGRRMEVVYALARAHLAGRTALDAPTLAWMIWRGWEQAEATANLRECISLIRRVIPDLIGGGRRVGVGYWLNVDEPAAVADEAVA